jgi:hypothetical protein
MGELAMKLHLAAAFRAFRRTLVSGPVIAAPPPTFDELTVQFNRFISERAPLFPEEAVLLAGFITGLAKGIAPVSAPPSTESAPTGEELLASLHRFFTERAPAHPLEAMTVAAFLAGVAKTLSPKLAELFVAINAAPSTDPDPTPPKPPSTDGEVN